MDWVIKIAGAVALVLIVAGIVATIIAAVGGNISNGGDGF